MLLGSINLYPILYLHTAFCKMMSKSHLVGKYPTHNVSFFPKLSGDAVHGDRSGEADEAAEAVGRKNSVFGLSDAQRA